MNDITTESILAQVQKSSAARTRVTNLPEAAGTPSATSQDLEGELRRSDRSRTRSARAKDGDEKLAVNKQRAERARRTQARNKKANSSQAQSDSESIIFGLVSGASEINNDGRDPSHSPTPIATTEETEAQITRSNLKEKLARKFDQVLEHSGTQTLMEVDDAISADPAYASQPEEQGPEARFLSPFVVGAGGGFHLDHPAHRPGNDRTYRGSKGGPRTIARSDSPVPTESTQLEDQLDPPHIQPFLTSEQEAPALQLNPFTGLEPRYSAAGSGHYLGYPEDQGSHRSASPVSPDENPAPSRLLGAHSSTPSLTRELFSDGSSRRYHQLQRDNSATFFSTSSKSLGYPIPASSHASDREEEQYATSTSARSQAKRPLEAPATPLPARKRPAPSFGPTTGGKVYNTRLDIAEINSHRALSQEISRRRATPSQARQKGKSLKAVGARTRAPARADSPASTTRTQKTGNDNVDLLDELDLDQHLVDSSAKGILVDDPGYRKPTAQDLTGTERALWTDTLKLTWAYSIGAGNFQTRAVYASWVTACYRKTLERKLPNLDTTNMAMSDDMMTVILNNLCNERYKDYTRLCIPVSNYFEIRSPATGDERQNVKDRVSEIYPDYFHYQDTDNLIDPYEGAIMYVALESTFFWGPKAVGAMYPSLFRRNKDPLKEDRKHIAVLAYLATMIQFCLGEWKKGYFKKGTLNATTQESVWLCHFDGLKNVTVKAHKRLARTYDKWVETAYDASQAQRIFSRKHYVQAVVRQKDVRADTPSRSPSPVEGH